MNQNNHLSSLDIDELAQRFDKPDVVQALILMGSYARNEAGPNSDVDLVQSDEYEKWFTDPYEATKWIAGLRIARALIDRENFFTNGLQVRARNFVWDSTIQSRANIEASRRMVGWCEEANKAIEGLRLNNDIGGLLNACHGISWGLSEVIQIQRGVLITSDNNVFSEVELALDDNTQMIQLRRIAFGLMDRYTLSQRVSAGLQLFTLIAEQMSDVWQANDAQIIEHTAEQIRTFVPKIL